MDSFDSEPSPKSVPILGVTIHSLTADEALARLEQLLDERSPHQVATVNPEFLVLARDDPAFRNALLQADLRLADGTCIVVASWLLGRPLPCRHPGVDLVVSLASIAARRSESIYLLGAGPGVAEQAAAVLVHRFPTLRLAGAEMGPAQGNHLPKEGEEALVGRIRASGASILLVAFGAPLQETWLARHKQALGVPIAIGVGGSFDVLSGRVPRAPRLMRHLGLEWLFRLVRMPWRWRRQLGRLPRFVALVLLQALRGPNAWRPDTSTAQS